MTRAKRSVIRLASRLMGERRAPPPPTHRAQMRQSKTDSSWHPWPVRKSNSFISAVPAWASDSGQTRPSPPPSLPLSLSPFLPLSHRWRSWRNAAESSRELCSLLLASWIFTSQIEVKLSHKSHIYRCCWDQSSPQRACVVVVKGLFWPWLKSMMSDKELSWGLLCRAPGCVAQRWHLWYCVFAFSEYSQKFSHEDQTISTTETLI